MSERDRTSRVGEVVAGNYEVLGLAGAGGMGIVYRARDLKLRRTVALKFLPPDLNSNKKEKQYFLREARMASSLDHPNIGVIHGIEETEDGSTFIVMAFYEGASLGDMIVPGGLPVAQVVDIASQMARGLEDAHAHHIVHRDIKPSNVMITEKSLAKIVDFGLAYASEQTASVGQGPTGTVGYMSPEQIMGKVADQRTDIWALGVVLVEMLTGEHPFQHEGLSATLFAILNEAPRHVEKAPEVMQQIVYRALSKDEAKRYQNCGEVLHDLEAAATALSAKDGAAATSSRLKRSGELNRYKKNASASRLAPTATASKSGWIRWAAVAAPVAIGALALVTPVRERVVGMFAADRQRHVAVLPFTNIGNDPANEPLVGGLMDSLTGKLSNLDVGNQSLWVVPASEVRRLKVSDPANALKELGATLVVEGSVARDGQAVRLDLNLIDAKTRRQIGSVDFADQGGDLATLQSEAVARLAHLMNITVTADMLRNTGGSVMPAAYQDYVSALGYMQRYDKAGNLDQAIGKLQEAVKTDPRFALGYAELGEAYRLKYRVDQSPRWLTEAQGNLEKAVQLDNRQPAAYVTLARIHDTLGSHDLALQEFQHALTLNPRDAAALGGLAGAYEHSGRVADAESAFQKSAALRPEYWDGYNTLGGFYDRQGKYPQAIAAFRHALELTPDNAQIYLNLGGVYLDSGDVKLLPEAEKLLERSIALGPSYPAYANLGNLYLTEARYPEAASALESALKLNDQDYLVWGNLLGAYEWLKEQTKAEKVRKRIQELVEQAVKLKPQDAMAQSTLAELYAHDRLNEKATMKIQTSLALAPDDPNILINVAETYEVMGDRRRAMEAVEKAVAKGYSVSAIKAEPELQALVRDPGYKFRSK
jgi:serine/threonine protein kinase/tetratricopeptide (TPR) repeat protein